MSTSNLSPLRGEIWKVNFNPTVGDEIQKTRPAVVISSDSVGVLKVKLVAPITKWKNSFSGKLWLVPISPNERNGLTQPSVIDSLQIRGVAIERFIEKIGRVSAIEIEEIAAAIAIIVEFQ